MTPFRLRKIAVEKYGKHWHGKLADGLKVHRTTVCRWAMGRTKITPIIEKAIVQHLSEVEKNETCRGL